MLNQYIALYLSSAKVLLVYIMEKNVGGTDRNIRFVVGLLLIILGIIGYAGMLSLAIGPIPQALMSIVLVLIGVILLVTGYTQKCPLNSILGINTCNRRSR